MFDVRQKKLLWTKGRAAFSLTKDAYSRTRSLVCRCSAGLGLWFAAHSPLLIWAAGLPGWVAGSPPLSAISHVGCWATWLGCWFASNCHKALGSWVYDSPPLSWDPGLPDWDTASLPLRWPLTAMNLQAPGLLHWLMFHWAASHSNCLQLPWISRPPSSRLLGCWAESMVCWTVSQVGHCLPLLSMFLAVITWISNYNEKDPF